MDKQWETKGTGSTEFHSSRKERYENGGIGNPKEKKGFFQRNPSYRIYLIDLILIVIISGVIVPFIMKREGSSKIDNYKLTFKAFEYDDEILLTLKITETEDIDTDSLVEARFYFEDSRGESLESDLLPSKLEERIIKSSIISNAVDYAYCDILINGKKKTIKKRIQ